MKIRTDFVTNSSSSSYVIELSISYSNDQGMNTIEFSDEYAEEAGECFFTHQEHSPKALGKADSVDALVSMLLDCIGNDNDDDEEIENKKSEVMEYLENSEDNEADDDDIWEPIPPAKKFAKFLNKVKEIQNIDEISEIVISCEGENNQESTSEFYSFNRVTNDYSRSKDFDSIDCGDDMLSQQLYFTDSSQATCVDKE